MKKKECGGLMMKREDLKAYALERALQIEDDVFATECETVSFLLDNCDITVPDASRYFVKVNCGGIQGLAWQKRAERFKDEFASSPYYAGHRQLAFTGDYDFGHTSAEWESVIGLGIYGLKKRIEEYYDRTRNSESDENTAKKLAFYEGLLKVYGAALRFMARAAEAARGCGKNEMANGLDNLCKGAPANLFEAIQTVFVYYVLQHHAAGTNLRTLGRLDSLLYPFYANEEAESAEKMMIDMLKEIDAEKVEANIPFALGGSGADGNTLANPLTELILDCYAKADTAYVKLHLLVSKDMPRSIVRKALYHVRNGSNSIVFMSDEKVIESLVKLGEEQRYARNYHVVGCYECGSDGEITCSCNARVSVPKALEYALNGGNDVLSGRQIGLPCKTEYESFEELFAEFTRQLTFLSDCAMKITDLCEKHYAECHAAPVLSGTYTSALENGGDIYCHNGARYNNSSVNAIGLATAVDSLAAIRKLVFEDKRMTVAELSEILRNNWEGNEPLRLLIKNKYPKYGTGDASVDAIAKRTVDALHAAISGKPNVKGGVYRLGTFTIDWRWGFGKKTSASADGRKAKEPVSQNADATFGCDREGATAHLTSVAALDASRTPNGTVVDIDLHSSAVVGENGLNALAATLEAYFAMGGFAVQYNVLNTEVLLDARKYPDKYPSLQVRLCGWNVLFAALSDKEKDEFIMRSAKEAGV